jgi:hypothetical protein
MQDDKIQRKVYSKLSSRYTDIGSFESFQNDLKDEKKRKKIYDAVKNDYSDIGDYELFSSKILSATPKTSSTSEVGSIANEVMQEVTGSNQLNKQEQTSPKSKLTGSYGTINPNIIDPLAKEQPVIPTNPAVKEEAQTQAPATPVNEELTGQERVNAFAKQMELQAGMNKFKSNIDKDLNAFDVASKQNVFNPTVQKIGNEYVDALGNRHSSEIEAIKTNQDLSKMYAQSPNTSLRGRRQEIESIIENSNKEYEKQLSEIEKQITDRQNIVREEHSKKMNASTDEFKSYRETQPDFSSDEDLKKLYDLKNNLYKAHKVELHNLNQALERLNRQVDKIEGNEAGFWQGALDKVTDSRTWDFGLQDLDEALIQNNFNENYNNLSQQEKEGVNKMLEAIYRNQFLSQEYQDSKMYGYGEMLGVMPSFAVDLFTGAGLIGKGVKVGTKVGTKLATKAVGKEVAEEIAEKGTLKYIQSNGLKGARDIASQNFIKFLGQSADDVAKASIVTSVPQGMKTGAGIIDRKLGNVVEDEQGNLKFEDEKSWNNAIYNEVTDRVVEAFSEMFGGHLGKVTLKGVGELADAVGAKKIGSVLLTADAKMLDGSLKKIKDAFSKVGINDLSGEALEEYYGQLWRTVLNQEDAYITNPDGSKTNLLAVKDFHVDLVVGLGLTMGAMKSVQYPFSAIAYIYTKNKVRKAGNKASAEVGAEKWKEIKQLIDNATNQDVSKIVADVFLKENISGKGKLAVLDYVAKTAFLRGYNIGELSQNIEQDLNEVDKTLAERKRRENENYLIGYNATGEQKVDIKDRYEASRQRLEELGISTDNAEGYSDLYAPAEGFQGNGESAKANAVYSFINSDTQYNGLIEASKDDIDIEVESNGYIIDSRINPDTNKIIKAKNIQGEEVYVVKGNIRVNEQGEAEIIEGDSVVIQKADGTQEMVSPTDLAEFEEIEPEQLKEESNATIKQTLAQQKADEIEGIVPLQVGMQVQGLGVISAIDEQGNVAIQIEGRKEPTIVPYNSVQALLQQQRVDAIKQQQAQSVEETPQPQQINAEDVGLGFTANVNGETLEVVGVYEDKLMVDYQGKTIPMTKEEIAEIVNNAQPIEQPTEEVAETTENNKENNKEKNAPDEKIIGQNTDNQSTEIGKSIGNEVSKKDTDYLNLSDVDAWNTLVAECNGDVETANEIVNETIEDAEKALQKIKNAKLKRGNSVAEKIAIRNEHQQNIANAEAVLEKWKAIANVPNMQPVAEETTPAIEEVVATDVAEIPDITEDKPQDARNRGFRRVNGQRVDRQSKLDVKKGKETNVRFAENVTQQGNYTVVEASDLQPSHINGQRNPLHFIEEAQPKERTDNASTESAKRIAENIRPEEITTTTTAYVGTPTINERGEIIQGNNRGIALRTMYAGYKESAQKYKQYLIDHAEEFGLNPADIEAMENPVLVNMLAVEDKKAIELGQYVAQDTESGGVERIKPKNVVQKMGEKIKNFANILFRSSDEDSSLAELIDQNGAEVLNWLAKNNFISDTQYQSAFDSKGNLTAEAKNDLRNVLYNSLFKNAPSRLEEMFNNLPAKAQKGILATAFRDFNSPNSEKMLAEIQQSIIAYNYLLNDANFVNAKTYTSIREAIEGWRKQTQFDDATGESFLPAEKFSNFALHLVGLYKGQTQKYVQNVFNELYDLIQGTKADNLFETNDKTKRTLAEAIKEVLDIDYKPIQKTKQNGRNGSNVLGNDTQNGEERGRRSNETIERGESNEDRQGTDDSARGIRGDKARNGNDGKRTDDLSQRKEVSGAERTEMENRIIDWLSEENLLKAKDKTRAEIFEIFGNELHPIAYIPKQYLHLLGGNVKDARIYCGKGYFINHALRNHANADYQTSIENIDVSKYLNIQTVLDAPDSVKETFVDGKKTIVFIKKIGRYFAELTQTEENGKIILHKSFFNQKKEPYAKLQDVKSKTSSEGGDTSISHTDNTVPAISLESRDDVMKETDDSVNLSDSKDTTNSKKVNSLEQENTTNIENEEVVKDENPVKQRLQELRKEYASETNMFERVKLEDEVIDIIKNEFGVTIPFVKVGTLLGASEEDFAYLLSEIEKENNPIKAFEQRNKSLSKLSKEENARRQPLRKRAKEWEEKVGVKVRIIESVDEVRNQKARQAIKAGRNVTGWYNVAQNEVYIYLPNITSEKEIDNTYLHEVVAHKGLRELLGQEKFDALCNRVWNSMSKEAQEEYAEYVGAKEKPTQKQQRAAADEYMAFLAEKTDLTEEEKNIWNKLVDWVKEVLSDIFNTKLTDEQIQDLIRASYQNLMTTSNSQENLDDNEYRFRENKNELVAVHNITEEDLRKVFEIGGLIMPSIAITKADIGHSGYGEISLLFDKNTIDPADRRNKVFGGDAWTPRFPRMVPKLNDDVMRSVRDKISKLLLNDEIREYYSLSAELYPNNIEKVIADYGVAGYYNKEWLKIAYLLDKGMKFKIPTKDKDYGEVAEGLIRLAKEKGLSLKDIQQEGYNFYENNPDFVADVEEAGIEKKLERISEKDREEVRELLLKKPMGFNAFDNHVNQAIQLENDLANGGKKQIIDSRAIGESINKKVKTNNVDYNKWVDNLFEGIVEKYGIRNNRDWYTPSGNRRSWEQLYDDVTPENILRYMLAQNEQGGSGGLWDSNIMGASADTYESIEEIREKGKERLRKIDATEYEEWASSVTDRITEICDEFLTEEQKNRFGGFIDAKISITNAVAKDKTAKGIYKKMKIDYPNFTMEHAKSLVNIVKEIQDYTIGYFEAKPQRIVSLSEVRKAIVPSNVSSDVLEKFNENGIDVATYRKGNEQSRQRLIKKESNDIRFRSIGGNSGYIGYSMSKRAGQAREEGRFPKTDFKKEYKVTPKSFDMLVRADIIQSGEWHHTSKFGNRTDFYHWVEDFYADIYEDNKKTIDKLSRENKFNDIETLFKEHPLSRKNEYDWETHRLADDLSKEKKSQIYKLKIELRDKKDEQVKMLKEELEQHPNVNKVGHNLYFNASNGVVMAVYGTEMKYPKESDKPRGVLRREAREELESVKSNILKTLPVVNNEYYSNEINRLEEEIAEDIRKFEEERELQWETSMVKDVEKDFDIRFRESNENQEIFVSNAEKSVKGIKQEKATPQQWLAMIEKNSGLKAGEDKWLGLSDWLKENKSKSLTKQEVLDFINENKIIIEEVEYSETNNQFKELKAEYEELVREQGSDYARKVMEERFGDDFFVVFDDLGGELVVNNYEDVSAFLGGNKIINSTRLNYTTEGLENKREIALTIPNIESWNEGDEVHFGDAGEGRAVAWVRFGETVAYDVIEDVKEVTEFHRPYKNASGNEVYRPKGNFSDKDFIVYGKARNGEMIYVVYINEKQIPLAHQTLEDAQKAMNEYYKEHPRKLRKPLRVLVIDEIQSKRHQEGRDKGYRPNTEIYLKRNGIEVKESDEYFEFYKNGELDRRFAKDILKNINKAKDLYVSGLSQTDIPDAPFEKNWHELAMKRMLRYASENGFDKVAWLTGEQQAERYNLSNHIDSISIEKSKEDSSKYDVTAWDGDYPISDITPNPVTENEIISIFGKELGNKLIEGYNNKNGFYTLENTDLKIGGEGMKGFYDKMLPSFVNKYAKKWGIKVEDVTLPNLAENNTMHSIDITDEMKESVMEGQVMFRISRTPEEFEATQKEAVEKKGIVLPNLNTAVVNIVNVPKHDFKGRLKEARNSAMEWAKDNFVGKIFELPNGNGNYIINQKAIKKYLDKTSIDNSDNAMVHLSALKELPEIISESIEAEIHADYKKGEDKVRRIENGIDNKGLLVHRLFSAIEIDGNLYRVKTTFNEFIDAQTQNSPHTYEITKIELIEDRTTPSETDSSNQMNRSTNSISVAKLLKDVEKSYDKGKKLLDESENISERQGEKTYTDEELSYENDPIAKVLGKPRYSLPQTKAFAKRQRERMLNHAVGVIEKLHLDNVEIVTDVETLQGKRKKAKGFYNTTTGKITIVMPNHTDIYDVQETILHEAVAHYGLRKLFGEHFDIFLDNVYNNASQEVREQIVELANKNYWDFAKATEEYLASLAETTNFEDAVNTSWWQKIKHLFVNMLRKLGLNDFRGETLTDNELRYILWRSYQNLIDPNAYSNPFAVAEDVVMQDELKVGNYATVNEERTKVAEEEVLFREQQEEENSIERYNRKINNGAYQSYEAFADSMASLKVVMEQATGEKVRDIAGYENAYLGENALSSANKAQIDWATEHLFNPLYNVVYSLAKNEEERKELDDYLLAKHGLERNEKMRADVEEANKKAIEKTNKINEELKADYTRRIIAGEEVGELKLQKPKLQKTNRDFAGLIGLTGIESVNGAEEKANQIVEEYEKKFNTKELWEKINAITKETLKKSLDSGIISVETYNKISSMYKYYIPLRGFDETTAEDMFSYLTNQEFGRFTPAFIKARGRRSKADNPFAFMESMYESAVLQGNRNTMVKQRFLTFVNNHPSELFSVSKDLWLQYDVEENTWKPVFPKIEEGDSAEVIKKKTAEFEKEMRQKAKEQPDSYKNASEGNERLPYKFEVKNNKHQHQIIVKQNGKDIVITVNGNPRVAQAINGLTNPDNDLTGALGALLGGAQNLNRYLSTMYTSASLDFVVRNFIRDLFYSNFMVWVRENPKYALRFNGNYLRFFFENLGRFLTGKNLFRKWRKGTLNRDNEVERLFEEFMLNGGETGYVELKNIEEHKKEIAKKIKKSKDVRKIIMYQLASVNRMIENNARFAAYYTSRNMGRDIARSVYDAKEISVNFNKKGAGSKFLNATGQTALGKASAFTSGAGRSLYIFWNPAIQGLAQFLRAYREHPIKSSVLTATAIGIGMFIAWWLSGDDDEEEKYYNIPERIRRQNLIIPIGENYLALPLPIEFRAFYGFGELLYSVTSGKEYMTSGELAKSIAEQFSQVLPINFLEGESPLMQLVPSAIRPIVEVGRNESWTGLPIYKDDSFGGIVEGHKPGHQNVYKNANPTFVEISKQINDWTGGDDVKEGSVDINPAIVEHLAKGYLGGIFNLSNDITNLISTALGDREFDVRDIPAYGAVVAKADERTQYRAVNNRYYEAKKEADEMRYLKKGYEKEIDEGNKEYNKVLEELKKTPEYKRFEIFEARRKGIDKLNRKLKKATEDNNEERMKELNTKLYEEKKEMLNKWRKVSEK